MSKAKKTEKKTPFEALCLLHSKTEVNTECVLSSRYGISTENNLKTTAEVTIKAIMPPSTVSRWWDRYGSPDWLISVGGWMSNEQARQPFYIQIEPISMTHQYVKTIGGEVSLHSDQIQQSHFIKWSRITQTEFWKTVLWILWDRSVRRGQGGHWVRFGLVGKAVKLTTILQKYNSSSQNAQCAWCCCYETCLQKP